MTSHKRTQNLLLDVVALAMVAIVSAPSVAHALRGWEYLVERLVRDGEPRSEVESIFADPRMPPFEKLEFSPERKPEPAALYRGFLRPQSVAQARRCWQTFLSELRTAERLTGVPGTVVASLLHVESRCGQNTGSHRVLFRLARLAMAGEPDNLNWNIALWFDRGGASASELVAKLSSRARYLEDTFYPEVRATLELARRWGIDPLELRGSSAGALGWPQFLPSSVLRFGRDGNHDGKVDLSEPADAALSAAEYLRAFGWRPQATREEQRRVLWNYNRSSSYVDTILALRQRLESGAPALERPRVAATTSSRARGKANRKAHRQRKAKATTLSQAVAP